jgi:RNA polymerase sigma-70 factor (ECF subfamily)
LTEALPHNDKELLQRIASGEEQAFTLLFLAYSKLLYPFVSELLGSSSQAEEMIQQTFLNIWLKRDKLREVEHPRAYIFRIAANECYMILRKKILARNYLQQLPEQNESDEHPIAHLSLQEVQGLIGEAVTQLPQTQRQIFCLSREQQLSVKEIAEKLELSPQTVKNNLTKALKQIRLHLEQSGYPIPVIIGASVLLQ